MRPLALSLRDLARLFGCSPRTLSRLVASGLFTPARVGRHPILTPAIARSQLARQLAAALGAPKRQRVGEPASTNRASRFASKRPLAEGEAGGGGVGSRDEGLGPTGPSVTNSIPKVLQVPDFNRKSGRGTPQRHPVIEEMVDGTL